MRTASLALTMLVTTIFAAGCGPKPAPRSGDATPLSKPEPTGGGSATDAVAQVNDGLAIFGQACAKCHGEAGEGAKAAPGLIGPNALPLLAQKPFDKRKTRVRSARDLFMWTREHMPEDTPGSLDDDQYLAVVAFLLKANAIALDRPLTPASSEAVLIHP